MRRSWWLAASVGVILVVLVLCVREAVLWVGRPFAGLLFADNLIVVSIGSSSWRDPQLRRTEWSRIMAVDDVPAQSASDVLRAISSRRPGDLVTYAFRRDDESFRVAIPVRTFTWQDFREVFAPMLVVGAFLVLSAAVLVAIRPDRSELRALYAACASFGLVLITGPDQYGPWRFTSLYLMSLAAVPPAMLHLAAAYPWQRRAWVTRAVRGAYVLFAVVGVLLIVLRERPGVFLALLYLVYLTLANATLLYAGSLIGALVTGRRSRLQLAIALAAVLGSCSVGALVLVVYPLMTEPIAPAWIVLPVALMPILSGVAFLAVPDGPRVAEATS
ncbi:MAG TPA: hypothetical protein VIS07_07960 [Candidatus Binatia bacterium]